MQKVTLAFVLALMVLAGCGSRTTTAPATAPESNTEAAGTAAGTAEQPSPEQAVKPAATNLPKLWD